MERGRMPSVQKQPHEQEQQVDQGRRHPDARVVPLVPVVGHAPTSSSLDPSIHPSRPSTWYIELSKLERSYLLPERTRLRSNNSPTAATTAPTTMRHLIAPEAADGPSPSLPPPASGSSGTVRRVASLVPEQLADGG